VSICILRAYSGRVEEAGCGYCVAVEAEDVERWEVYCEAEGRLAEVVGDGLGVEGSAPGGLGQLLPLMAGLGVKG
jgi:hypothetical protein